MSIGHALVSCYIYIYISSDYVECQYTIRGLSQSMSSPSVEAMACLRHLAQYLLGCTEHAMVLKHEAHNCFTTIHVTILLRFTVTQIGRNTNKHVDQYL